jgi:hypothetical protein
VAVAVEAVQGLLALIQLRPFKLVQVVAQDFAQPLLVSVFFMLEAVGVVNGNLPQGLPHLAVLEAVEMAVVVLLWWRLLLAHPTQAVVVAVEVIITMEKLEPLAALAS